MKKFKKMIFTLLLALLVLPVLNAVSVDVKTEEELLDAVKSDGTIVLKEDITLTKALEVKGNDVIIDLNGKTITVQNGYNGYFDLFKGMLEFTGKGTIKDVRVKERVAATIWVEGSTDVNDKDYSTLTIGKDVTIDTTQWGIAVSDTEYKAYGLTVNFNGKIVSSAKDGGGITVFGNVKNVGNDLNNAPVLNLNKTAYVEAVGDEALYGAGVGIWNISGGEYIGKSTIGVKSGKFVINDGTFTANGERKTGTLYGNGMYSTGSAIQIENNEAYSGNIEIVVNGGTFKSEKGLSIYHYPPDKNLKNGLKSLIINDGKFVGDVEMVDGDSVIINKGTFSTSSVVNYVPKTYSMTKISENEYVVTNIEYLDVEGASTEIYSNNVLDMHYAKPGEKVTLKINVEEGYYVKTVTVVGKDDSKTVVEVKNNEFVMPEFAVKVMVDTARCIGKDGNIVQIDKELSFSKDINKDVVKDLMDTTVENKDSGLVEAIDTDKLVTSDNTSLIEVQIETELTEYDEEKNILTYDIKPVYYVDGEEAGVVPNEAINGKVKVNLPVPSNVKDTHVKVIHKSGEKVIDEKTYEIKSTEDGKKYITIETESFSTFELSFYTTEKVENPQTGDNVILYIGISLISLLCMSAIVVVKKHF